MKIEQLVVQYLYNNKKVTLQEIGSFTISPDIIIPVDNDKEGALPPDAISFEHDGKAVIDEGLVDFVVQQTRKIRPLAMSDLESYSILSKQFLNIGKPMIIEGLGMLLKNQSGIYEFTQSTTSNARLEPLQAQVREKENEAISFASPQKKQSSKKGFAILLIIILLALIAVALYYFLRNNNKDNSLQKVEETADTIVTEKPAPVITDTTKTDSLKKIIADTAKTITPPADGYTFKVVIKEYPTQAAAQKAYTRLTGYGNTLVMSTVDSVHYRLAIPFKTPLSDTLRAKDSLAKFFQSKTFIDL